MRRLQNGYYINRNYSRTKCDLFKVRWVGIKDIIGYYDITWYDPYYKKFIPSSTYVDYIIENCNPISKEDVFLELL